MPCGMPGGQQSSAALGHNTKWRPLVRFALKLILAGRARYEWRPVVIPGGGGECGQRANTPCKMKKEPVVGPSCPRAWGTGLWSAKVRGRKRLALGRRRSARTKGRDKLCGHKGLWNGPQRCAHLVRWGSGDGGGGGGMRNGAQLGYGEPSSTREGIHASLPLNLRSRSACLLRCKMHPLGVDTATWGYAEHRPGAQRASSALCIARTMWLPTRCAQSGQ